MQGIFYVTVVVDNRHMEVVAGDSFLQEVLAVEYHSPYKVVVP